MRKIGMVFLLCCGFARTYGQTPEQQKIKLVENGLRPNAAILFADSAVKKYTIEERMTYYGVPSVSVAVIHDGKLVWAKAYGFADEKGQKPANPKTLYQAASLSKTVNAFCILRLTQESRLSLDQDIRSYLKTWSFPDNDFSRGKKITLRNLLSHTAGLNVGGFRGYDFGDSIPSINQMLDGKRPANTEAIKPIFPPNTQMQYSGGGVLISKKILLDNVNPDYSALMNKVVFKPLGMNASTFDLHLPNGMKNVALGYDNNQKEITEMVYPEQAPDGLLTTPADFSKLIISIQQSLSGKGGLLEKKIADEMITTGLQGSDAALGTFLMEREGQNYFWHRGANMGFKSIYYGSCTGGNGVVVMINSENDQILDEIVNSVAIAYDWKNFYNPEIRKLVTVPDNIAKDYTGEYRSEQPSLVVQIRNTKGVLELSARKDNGFEKMYFTSPSSFFLMSSPNTLAVFLTDDGGKSYHLQVSQGTKVLFTAKKQ